MGLSVNTKKLRVLLSMLVFLSVVLGLYIYQQNKEKRKNEIKQLVFEAEQSLLQLN